MRLRNIPGAKDAITESSYVVQMPAEWKGKWNERFSKEQPLHIEVGMGKGRFLMDMAKLHPEINYVGIEMYDSVLLRALQKRERLEADGVKLDNLMFMCIDARLLPEIFEKGEVSRIYLNFSDPWPKARHAKRRLTSREFLARYSQILKTGETVEFKTDNKDLFEFFKFMIAFRKKHPVIHKQLPTSVCGMDPIHTHNLNAEETDIPRDARTFLARHVRYF